MKQILLNKSHDVTEFASTDASRYVINGVHYNKAKGCVEATNGRILIRVPVVESDGEFPDVKTALPEEPVDCIIPRDAYLKALRNIPKSNLPILESVKLDANGKITLTTFDLDTEQAVTCKPVEGTYPNVDQVIPTEEPTMKIAIAGGLLKTIAAYALKHGVDDNQTVQFEIIDSTSPVTFKIAVDKDRPNMEALGLVCPVRLA